MILDKTGAISASSFCSVPDGRVGEQCPRFMALSMAIATVTAAAERRPNGQHAWNERAGSTSPAFAHDDALGEGISCSH